MLTRRGSSADPRRVHRAARLYLPLSFFWSLHGRRKEAILSLRWPQVDLEAGRIDFEVAGRRRTNKKRGVIQIPPRLLPHLRRARKRGTDLGYVLHINGNRIKDLKRGFAAACDRAGLEGVSPHTLRHTAATWLMQSGTDIWQASGFLSMSMETLQRVMGTTTRTISERLPRTSVGVRRMSA
jgi:integrase